MGPDRVVLLPPVLNHNLGFLQAREYFSVQHLISELAIEALIIPVLPRAAGFNEQRLHPNMPQPLPHHPSRELWPVVGADMLRYPVADKQLRQTVEHIVAGNVPLNQERQALSAILVNQGQNLQRAAVVGALTDKIIGPHMSAMHGPQAHTRTVV